MRRNSRKAAIVPIRAARDGKAAAAARCCRRRRACGARRAAPANAQDDVAVAQARHADAAVGHTSAASVSRVVSTTSSPARKPGFTDGFGNTMRSSSCLTV